MKKNNLIPTYYLRFQMFLLQILSFCLFFSYHPVIPLAKTDSMNLEFSLPLLWLMLFSLLSLPSVIKTFQKAFLYPKHKQNLALFFSLVFPLYSSLSILWSKNQLRAVLTSGIIWCIYSSLLTFSKIIVLNKYQLEKQIKRNLLLSGVIFSVFCWLQSILDVFGVPPSQTLLCQGCVSQTFGFPHPNGFAIEPQFMGNLLLAPIFLCLFYVFEYNQPQAQASFSSNNLFKKNLHSRYIYVLISIFLVTTLYLTFSRGAIFSFWIGLFLLFTFKIISSFKSYKSINSNIKYSNTKQKATSKVRINLKEAKNKKKYPLCTFLQFLCIVFFPLILSLFFQGIFTALGPTNHSFLDGVSTSVNHLSLGHLNLSFLKPKQTLSNDNFQLSPFVATESQKNAPNFSGYIKESTSIRLNLNNLALSSWRQSMPRLLLGVGLGGTGLSLFQDFPELGSPKEIIQNEYIAILYELGIIGLLLIITTITSLTIYILYNKNKEKSSKRGKSSSLVSIRLSFIDFFIIQSSSYWCYIFVLIITYCLTLCFFSGLPNVLHIYLLSFIQITLSLSKQKS